MDHNIPKKTSQPDTQPIPTPLINPAPYQKHKNIPIKIIHSKSKDLDQILYVRKETTDNTNKSKGDQRDESKFYFGIF